MKLPRKPLLFGLLLGGMVCALVAHAYPMPGDSQEVYVTYYSNAARTQVVGVLGVSHGSACQAWHATWGNVTAYSRVTVANCPNLD